MTTEDKKRWLSALASYALLSLPLLGAHVSLGGYADIWMAGYAGLGLVALLRGLQRGERAQVALGMFMLLLTLAVKREGGMWVGVGILLLLAAAPMRIILAGLATAVVGALLVWALGGLTVTLPGTRPISIAAGPTATSMLPQFGE